MGHEVMPDDALCASIGHAAKEARLQRGLKQWDVAASVGITHEVYGRLERGQMMPSVPTLRRVCVALGISADAAFGFPSSGEPRRAPRPEPPEKPLVRRLTLRAAGLEASALRALLNVTSHMGDNRRRRAQKPRSRRTKPRL